MKSALEAIGFNKMDDAMDVFDPVAVKYINQQWIDDQMKNRENDFTDPVNCLIYCGTWNCNALQEENSLDEWLLPPGQHYADIYAIGIQKMVELNSPSDLTSENTKLRAEYWRECFTQCLEKTKIGYSCAMEKNVGGLLLCVFIKDSLLPFVGDVRETSTLAGSSSGLGKKGAVAIRMTVHDTSLCFVSAHLSAHRGNVLGRNAEFRNIMEKTRFPATEKKPKGNVFIEVEMPKRGAAKTLSSDLTIDDHDVILWMGDLNYRIDEVFPTEEVMGRVIGGYFDDLLKADQLTMEREKGNVFQGFSEGLIQFPPTYKYQPGTGDFDTRTEKKVRAPAWCDRVLWKCSSMSRNVVEQLYYHSVDVFRISDHFPVCAVMETGLRRVVEEKQVTVFNELMTVLEDNESTLSPDVEVIGLDIHFDEVYYDEPIESVVEIHNKGKTSACWHFIPKNSEPTTSKPWVSFDKSKGLLLPDEKMEVTITVWVDKKTAQNLNSSLDKLEDVIVLRVENFKDFHILVSGDYIRSCFGIFLEELVFIIQPVATTNLPEAECEVVFDDFDTKSTNKNQQMNVNTNLDKTGSSKLGIPKEIWRLVDALWSGDGLKEKHLFASVADESEVRAVRRSIDFSTEFPLCSPHALSNCLIALLQALPAPLIPQELYPQSEEDVAHVKVFARKLLEDLSPLSGNVVVYLLSFFREVLAESNSNRCTAALLANVCLSCMTSEIPEKKDNDHLSEFMQSLEKNIRLKLEIRRGLLEGVLVYLLTTSSL